MTGTLICDYCGEKVKDPIQRGARVYCCQACAFEAGRSKDCSGRADGHIGQPAQELDLTQLKDRR